MDNWPILGLDTWVRVPLLTPFAGVVQRIVYQPSKLRTWVQLPSPAPYLGMTELVDVQDLGSCGLSCVGSIPITRTRVTSRPIQLVELGKGLRKGGLFLCPKIKSFHHGQL